MSFQKKNKKNSHKFKCLNNLQHLSIIMDGNGRWANNKGWPRYFGHFRGVKVCLNIVKSCISFNIPYLTLFAFSTENWKRSKIEIAVLVKLFKRTFIKYQSELNRHQVRVHILGNLAEFDQSLQDTCNDLVKNTKHNTGLQLVIALNYGGRREIIQAVQKLYKEVKTGTIDIKDINENNFANYLSSATFPNPDLIIRTGNVSRLSNFYLWSAAYSEIYVSSLLWPNFNEAELIRALEFYNQTKRRFGATNNSEKNTDE